MPQDKRLVQAENGYPSQNYNPTTGAYEEAHSEGNTPFVQDKAAHTRLDAIEQALAGTLNTQLTGSSLEQRGLSTNKPLATEVQIGTTYWSLDTDPQGDAIEVSDGTQWVVLA